MPRPGRNALVCWKGGARPCLARTERVSLLERWGEAMPHPDGTRVSLLERWGEASASPGRNAG